MFEIMDLYEVMNGDYSEISEALSDGMRHVFLNMDAAVYKAFSKIYQVFFEVSRVTFLNGDFYSIIFQRVFFILSVFMLFKLTISFISYVISPDAATDPKNPKNMGKLIGRVIVTILFLVVLVPVGNNTSYATNTEDSAYASDSYKSDCELDPSGGCKKDAEGHIIYRTLTMTENIQNQGILFGTLQTVQNAILSPSNNVIGKLILGENAASAEDDEFGDTIMMTTFSSFFYVNPKAVDTGNGIYGKDQYGDDIGICLNSGTETKVSINYMVRDFDEVKKVAPVVCEGSGKNLFVYDVFISTIAGLAITVLTFLFTFDVALRAIKLGILRLIAPIPAISYIDPKSAQDGAFANYTKTLLNTYVDIFLRLAIIYFVVMLLSNVASPDSSIINYHGAGGFAKIIVIITLLFFATSAPQFIMQALGIKSTGKGLGFGAGLLGGALGGGLAGLASGGLLGGLSGMMGGMKAGAGNFNQAAAGQKTNMSSWQAARNRGAQLGSGDPNAKPQDGFMGLTNAIRNRGINSKSVGRAKQDMYDLQNRAQHAQTDFTNNPNNLYGDVSEKYQGKYGNSSWQQVAEGMNSAVSIAQGEVTKYQQAREKALATYQGALASGDASLAASARTSLSNIETKLTDAQSDLVAAQDARQEAMTDYSEYISKEAGQAESKYKKGDDLLNRTSQTYRRRGAKDVRDKYH